MITASKTKTPYCVTITNGDTSVYSDIAKERGGKAEAFRPHEFLCAAYASCFHITDEGTNIVCNQALSAFIGRHRPGVHTID